MDLDFSKANKLTANSVHKPNVKIGRDTLEDVEKRALWRSVIDYMEVDLPAKKFEIHFI